MIEQEWRARKYIVRLSEDERLYLETIIRTGRDAARRLMKARILLKADISKGREGWSDSKIVAALETSTSSVLRLRRRFVEEGFDAAGPQEMRNPSRQGHF